MSEGPSSVASPLAANEECKAKVQMARSEVEKQQQRVRESLQGAELIGTPHASKLQRELDELTDEYNTLKAESRTLEEEWCEAAEIEKARANAYKVWHSCLLVRSSDPQCVGALMRMPLHLLAGSAGGGQQSAGMRREREQCYKAGPGREGAASERPRRAAEGGDPTSRDGGT